MIKMYVMRRPSLVGPKIRERDELVPEAHLWRLTEGMIRSGRLRETEVTEEEFTAAVDKYCPDLAEQIYKKLGIDPVTVPDVRRGKTRGKRTVATIPPVPVDDTPAAG